MKYLLVGEIVSTHGIKGEVKVNIVTDDLSRFDKGNSLYILKNNEYQKITVDSFRVHKNMGLLTFNNIKNINDCLGYVNCSLYINPEEVEALDEGEYYYDDLIGLEVVDVNNNNEVIGVVNDVVEVPQGCILRIKKKNGKNALVPYVDEFIKNVDLEKGIIEIESIEGLL